MEFSRKEVSCMRVNSDDVDSIREVIELYFETRDCDENEEASFTPDDDSSSESDTELDQDEEFNIDSSETDLSEKAKVNAFYSNTCQCKFGENEQACS